MFCWILKMSKFSKKWHLLQGNCHRGGPAGGSHPDGCSPHQWQGLPHPTPLVLLLVCWFGIVLYRFCLILFVCFAVFSLSCTCIWSYAGKELPVHSLNVQHLSFVYCEMFVLQSCVGMGGCMPMMVRFRAGSMHGKQLIANTTALKHVFSCWTSRKHIRMSLWFHGLMSLNGSIAERNLRVTAR